jgi:23S rRNA pseudouridine2605 synthase
MSGGDVDPRWSNPDLRDEGDSAASGSTSPGRKGGSDTRARGDFGPRRPERTGKPRARGGGTPDQRRSNSEPHVRKGTGGRQHAGQSDSKKPRVYTGGGGADRRPRDGSGRDPQRRRRDEQGSRPQRTGAGGASRHARDVRERGRGIPRRGAPRKDIEAPGGPRHPEAEGERLQKVLSRAGLASRREVEDWIRAGRITINGEPAVLGVRVSPSDQLRLDGRLIRQRESRSGPTVFVVHRSPGESLTQPHADTSEEGGEAPAPTSMIERLPSRAGRRFITISPMPRVDGGLELVTSDGELGVMLQRSVHKLVSQFSVRILGELSEQQLEGILGGMLDSGEQIEVQTCEPSGGEAANRWYTFVARGASGKEVRQLFERQGAVVSRVQRTHLGPITMERALGRGQFRELTPEEFSALTALPDE